MIIIGGQGDHKGTPLLYPCGCSGSFMRVRSTTIDTDIASLVYCFCYVLSLYIQPYVFVGIVCAMYADDVMGRL